MLQQAQALQDKAGERLDIIGFLSRGPYEVTKLSPSFLDACL